MRSGDIAESYEGPIAIARSHGRVALRLGRRLLFLDDDDARALAVELLHATGDLPPKNGGASGTFDVLKSVERIAVSVRRIFG